MSGLETSVNISVIIAVYQRADELKELLQSLSRQHFKNFEVIVVDDGSPNKLENVVNSFSELLNIKYFYKENSGAGRSRNYGMERAAGNYFIFLDSDTITPENYMETVRKELNENYADAFGGPDAADENFSDLQKAISFSMTSFLTTGGIRGGKKHVGKFQPRSFNMGISKKAFEKTGGFGNLRIGEDPDLSMRIWKEGLETRLFSNAKVYHKRRTSLKKFARQVRQFGVARPILDLLHPQYKKLTFWFPSLFITGLPLSLILYLVPLNSGTELRYLSGLPLLIYLIYFQLIFISSAIQFQSLKIGFLTVLTTLIQFFNYGTGFLNSWFRLHILKQRPEKAFPWYFHQNSL